MRTASPSRCGVQNGSSRPAYLLPSIRTDAVNEAALDRCGEALCEGEDPLTVNESVAKELLA